MIDMQEHLIENSCPTLSLLLLFLLFDGRRYLKEIESLKDIEIALDIAR